MHTNANDDFTSIKVAIVHEWLVSFRGSEKVLLELARMFPQAVIYASVLDRSALPKELAVRDIRTTFIQKLPNAIRWYQKYLPLMPMAFESLDLKEYDLIISSSHCCAKGIIPRPDAVHISYCYTPMRYAWSEYHAYRTTLKNSLSRKIMSLMMVHLRIWDVSTTPRVDQFIACSHAVQRRIRRYYGRDSEVIYPPSPSLNKELYREDYQTLLAKWVPEIGDQPFYLTLGRLVGYKRVDMAIAACNQLNLPLIVAGTGPELIRLRKNAGSHVHFVGEVSDELAFILYEKCIAFIFPGEEDFGLTIVEAQMHGKPVIAYGRGGAEDTVIDGETGVLFDVQDVKSLVNAIKRSRILSFDARRIASHGNKFSVDNFSKQIREQVRHSFS